MILLMHNHATSSPCSSSNLRCQFSPTSLQLHKSTLPIFPTLGIAAIAPLCVWAPNLFLKPRTINGQDSSAAPAVDSADFADFVGAADPNTDRCVSTGPASSAYPLDEFYYLASPASSPCSSSNLHCRFSPTGLHLQKSALLIFPIVGIAAIATLCI